MAWTAPATWSVSEVVIASKMNAQIRDNLSYLKGLAGAIYLQDNLGVTDATASSDWSPPSQYLTVATAANPGAAGLALKGARAGSDSAFAYISGVNLSATGADKSGGVILFARDGAADSASMIFQTRNAGVIAERLRITKEGFLNAKAATGGGMLFVSCTAVTALQTPVAAGTVTQFALFYMIDRNNTGGAIVPTSGNGLQLTQTFTSVNTDTITVTLTAGGAITVQRTAGTNGTHEIEMLVLYK